MGEVPNNSKALNFTPNVLYTPNVLSQSAVANTDKVLQTPGSGVINIWWTDSTGNIVSEIPYGESIMLNMTTVMSGLNFKISLYANRYLFSETIFLSNTSRKSSFVFDTKKINIPGDADISGDVNFLKGNIATNIPSLKVSIIPYISTIMKAKGWATAVKCMEKWFNNPYNPAQTKDDLVVLDILKMDWVLSFGYLNKIIEKGFHTITESGFSAVIGDEIKKSIKAQVNNNLAKLPENEGQTVSFGTKDTTIERVKQKDGESFKMVNVPRFHRYQIYTTVYRSAAGALTAPGEIVPTINDFYAAVANTAFKYIAFGNISKVGNKYKIEVKQLGVYVYDGFDFEGDQDLGYWNVKTNDVGRTFIGGGSKGTLVTNKMFRDWRDRNRKGQDYTNYSDISIRDVSFAFEASENELKP